MPQNDIYQLNVDATLWGQEVRQVHHFRQDSPDPVSPVGTTLINAWDQNVKQPYLDCVADDFQFTVSSARRVWPNPSQTVFLTTAGGGALVGMAASANTVAVTGYYGRGNPAWVVGRTFMSGLRELDIHAGLINAATITLIKTFITALLGEIQDAGTSTSWKKVIWRTAQLTALDILQGQIRTRTSKLRSRTKGQGD